MKKFLTFLLLLPLVVKANGPYPTPGGGSGTNGFNGNADNATINNAHGTNIYGAFSGDASGLTNLAPPAIAAAGGVTNVPNGEIDAYALYGQLQGAMRKPWRSIYFSPSVVDVNGNREGQSNIVIAVTNMKTNGVLTVMSNLNCTMAVEIDTEGFHVRTNGGWALTMRNFGSQTRNMVYDTNIFPNGPWWLNDYLHTNGFKSYIHFYMTTSYLPTGADEFICDAAGGHFQAWTNGNGTFPTDPAGGQYGLCLSPDTITNDIAQLYAYGYDGIVKADGGSTPVDFKKLDAMVGNACLKIAIPARFPYYPYPGYANVNTNLFDLGLPGQYNSFYPVETFGKIMMVQAYQTISDASFTLGSLTIGANASYFYDNNANVPANEETDVPLRIMVRDFPTSTKAYGTYINWLGYCGKSSLPEIALTHGILSSGWFGEHFFGVPSSSPYAAPAFSNALTSVTFNQIIDDPDQNMPILLNDYGTNVGSVWATKLYGGSYAVGFFNNISSGITTNMTVTWSQLGIDSNSTMRVDDVLPPGTTTSQGRFTNSFTFALTAGASALEKITPCLPPTLVLNNTSGAARNQLTVNAINQEDYLFVGVLGNTFGGLIGMANGNGDLIFDSVQGDFVVREQSGSHRLLLGSGNGNASTVQISATGASITGNASENGAIITTNIAATSGSDTNMAAYDSTGKQIKVSINNLVATISGGGGNASTNPATPQVFSGTNTFLNTLRVGTPTLTNGINGLVINTGLTNGTANSTNSTAYVVGNRAVSPLTYFPVGAMSPLNVSNSPMSLDVMPAPGSVDYFGNGVSWIDICSTNCLFSNPTNLATLRLQVSSIINTGGNGNPSAYIGTELFNGGPGQFESLRMGIDGLSYMYFGITPGVQIDYGLYCESPGIDMGYNGGSWGTLYLANSFGGGVVFQNGSASIVLGAAGILVNNAGTNSFSGNEKMDSALFTNGIVTVNSNGLALNQITFPATTAKWTNTVANTVSPVRNIFLYIDNTGVTGTSMSKNGTVIASSVVAGDMMIAMKPGDFFSETYTVGTPVAKWEPQ